MACYKLCRADDGLGVVDRLEIASGWFARLRGLQFRSPLPAGSGLLLIPCASVHTWFVRGPLALVFLDSQGRITGVRRRVPPFWGARAARGTHAVLELASRQENLVRLDTLQSGQRLVVGGPGPLPSALEFLAA